MLFGVNTRAWAVFKQEMYVAGYAGWVYDNIITCKACDCGERGSWCGGHRQAVLVERGWCWRRQSVLRKGAINSPGRACEL